MFTTAPVVSANPNPAVPLAAVLRFSAGEPVDTTIRISDGKHEWELSYDEARNPADGLAVVGMRPDRRHQIRVFIRDAAGNVAEATGALEFTTPPLPSGHTEFPPLDVTVSRPERMEPGITLFSPRRVTRNIKLNQSFGMLLALDAAGEVVWYYRMNSRISDLQQLRSGNIMYLTQDFRLVEIDLLGNVVAQWYAAGRPEGPAEGAIPIETLAIHHEVDELPNGNLVILGVEQRAIDNYYTTEYDPDAPRRTHNVMGDEIIEFTRDGKEVWRWRAFDHLDPFRIGYGLTNNYWIQRGFPDTVDWTHANGLLYYEEDDSLSGQHADPEHGPEAGPRHWGDPLDSRRTGRLARQGEGPRSEARRRCALVSPPARPHPDSQRNPAAV